ncbi:MAG: phosphate ABC transporter permease subunit PstC [Planctomycetes bacterium]|nr:phosphate ABC transporter permease subunit PstC [Planctomycetota bacterium]
MTSLPASPTFISPRARPARLRLRAGIERLIEGALFLLTLLSIATTVGIIVILVRETWGFFTMRGADGQILVPISDFLGDSLWSPLLSDPPRFGVTSLVCGTLLVTAIAAVFALPLGLLTAVYLSEYAPPRVRGVVKSLLEILAGIPTVVYGFFALTFITPNLLQPISSSFGTHSAMSAGIAVGIMILPIVSSLAEDALRAVPQSLRDGSLALGSTKAETILRVVIPAALSGIVASFLLAITRAIGETMIVALAAGGSVAQLTLNPSAQVQTMTAWMVQVFLGDAPAGGIEYQSSYAVAFTLFAFTFVMTWVGALILRRYREVYE